MSVKKQLVVLLLVLGLIGAVAGLPRGSARAAAEPTYKAVRVWVNPEYDHPRDVTAPDPLVLTMIEGQIAGATPPVTVKFLIPASALMYSAGSLDAPGRTDTYARAPDWDGVSNIKPSGIDGWNVASFTLIKNTFRVEFYDDAAIRGLPDKTMAYDFRTVYPVSDLTLIIQEPRGASNFVVSPKEQSTSKDADGLTVHRYSFANVAANSATHFDISYTKADSTPSLGGSPAPAGSSPSASLLLAVALAVVVAAILVFVAAKSGSRRRAASRAGKRRNAGGKRVGPSAGGKRFCTECGNRIEGAPRYCPNCGAKV
ncbi:MAG: zinc ribbon domain-containing protein [Chloroflexi bacterium]|nr:zinc ribbon domain-containing protein [Chloroflexota bacterium]